MKALAALLSVSVMLLESEGCSRRDPPDRTYRAKSDGAYIFAVTLDPNPKNVRMDIWYDALGQRFLSGYAQSNLITVFDAALPLRKGDSLTMKFSEYQGYYQSFSVVKANDDYSFVTARSNGYSGGPGIVPFHTRITRDRTIHNSHFNSFLAPATGVYWVSLRADCGTHGWATIGLDHRYLTAECRWDTVITESGALHFEKGTQVQVKYLEGNINLESMTLLSFSLLQWNNQTYKTYLKVQRRVLSYTTRSFLAYTALSVASTTNPPVMNFTYRVNCNYGNMWVGSGDVFYRTLNNRPRQMGNFLGIVTQVPGIYLIATAGRNNDDIHDLFFDLYKVGIVDRKKKKLHTFFH